MSIYRRSGRRYEEPDEPLTISADVIAEYLERCNKPGMASFVRRMGKNDTEWYGRLRDEQTRYEALYQRFIQYEPEQPRHERNFQPPPEASD